MTVCFGGGSIQVFCTEIFFLCSVQTLSPPSFSYALAQLWLHVWYPETFHTKDCQQLDQDDFHLTFS